MAVAAAVFVFLAVAACAVALLGARDRGLSRPDARLRALAAAVPSGVAPDADALLRRRRRPALRGLLTESAWARSTARDLQQAGIRLRTSEYLLLRAGLAVFAAMVVVLLLRGNAVALALAPLAGVAGYVAPAFYLKNARRGRVARIEKQLIELLPALASSLRSGFAFEQGIEAAAEQLGPPLADELALLLHDVRLGANMQDALRALGERTGSADLDIAITAVLVQRSSGGNLAEVLDGVAETLRERERVRGDVQTFTAQQRLTGTILAVYPVLVGLVLLAIMPAIWSKLFTTPAGQVQLAIALGLQLLGFVAIRRSLRVDF